MAPLPPQPHRFTPDNVPRGIPFELAPPSQLSPPSPEALRPPGGGGFRTSRGGGIARGPPGPPAPQWRRAGPTRSPGCRPPVRTARRRLPHVVPRSRCPWHPPSPAVPRGDRRAHVLVVVLLQHPHVRPLPAARVLQPTPRSGARRAQQLPFLAGSPVAGGGAVTVSSGSGSRVVCLLMRLVSSLSSDHTGPCGLGGVAWACRAHMCFLLILGNRLHQCRLEMSMSKACFLAK